MTAREWLMNTAMDEQDKSLIWVSEHGCCWQICAATYTAHAIGGLSENDFIGAAKLHALA